MVYLNFMQCEERHAQLQQTPASKSLSSQSAEKNQGSSCDAENIVGLAETLARLVKPLELAAFSVAGLQVRIRMNNID